ncbi:Tn3 transposase DDE domain protein [Nonomuraea coxensis DSM 45129]|uniref:Tn3 transposase DDE domain protein n=1 Tax=Nonomuraea coxensis DSM 45129 TaxID=1122611 RepID=A0ABX8TUC3_9ACTN|nr:Tn3 family transposase [Nonomuraea coxensis]QYC38831.1 Tn3 transposase DDE domain protein [Nonomuraea coxensis DSM 45129]
MTSIERTAYPQFKRLTSARVLHVFFTPTADEIDWAQELARGSQTLFALILALKCFQKMARFPAREEIPEVVVDHVRRCLGLAGDVEPDHGAASTAKWHRKQIRARQGVIYDKEQARAIAAEAITEAAQAKNNPPDLINVALERLIEASLELPGFTTLDEMAATIRARVNAEIFTRVVDRMGVDGQERMGALLTTVGTDGRSLFNRLKKPAQRPTWAKFDAHVKYLDEIDALGDTWEWLEGIALTKITDFAGEAAAQDADTLSRYNPVKRLALLACLLHMARMRARDDLAEMLCKRVAANLKKARTALEGIRERQRAVSERLIGTYRTVLEHLDPEGPEADRGAERAVAAVNNAGGFDAQLADIEEVSAFHGDNYEVLAYRFFKRDRAVMFDLVAKLELKATSRDESVLTSLEHARAHAGLRRDFIPMPPPVDGSGGPGSGIMFASGNWRRAVTDRGRPGMVARRHFEAMVFTYLAEELRTGDIAVVGSNEYADWSANLLPWAECEPLLEGFCEQVGVPSTAAGFVAHLRSNHLAAAAELDAGYEDNADLVISDDGAPTVKRRRGQQTLKAAEKLAAAIERRMPERSLLSIVARTAHWLGWHHHFGPASGSDPKISDPLFRYSLTVFTGGINLGPYEAAKHLTGVSARELSMIRNRHIDIRKLNAAIGCVVNAFAELDVVKAWGDGTTVAADGTHVETYVDNLLAETSIRYGGVGGIAYHYVSDTYVALFSRFIPCGVWEAVYLIEGLLANDSDIQPTTVHADTQGQSFPVFALATLFGFDLMPRIRNFKDLIFFRADPHLVYPHIDALFGDRGRNVIDWELIERHWCDLMQVAISISEGRLSSATLMRRLRSNSRKNRIYKVFREVGRSVRTVALLRYLADPALRARVTAATNKVETYNGFSQWLGFGNNGVIADNDPEEQEKLIKLNTLLANLVIFHNALDLMDVVRTLVAEGWTITADELGALSPYLRAHIRRFGAYATDEIGDEPAAFNPELKEIDFTAVDLAA